MTKDDSPITKDKINGLTKTLSYILAGLEDGLQEFALESITLQRARETGFRCILRGYTRTSDRKPVRLVAFTNSDIAAECLLHAEHGFGTNAIRWHFDQFANGLGDNGSSAFKPASISHR